MQQSSTSIPVSMIVAMDRNRVIGRGGELPWRLPADLKRFQQVTMGKAILMGRRTFESIGRALPGRLNLVWSSAASPPAADVVLVRSFDGALEAVRSSVDYHQLVVIGGGSVYAAAFPFATTLDLTLVDVEIEDGDVWFPDFDRQEWVERSRTHIEADERNKHAFDAYLLERIEAGG